MPLMFDHGVGIFYQFTDIIQCLGGIGVVVSCWISVLELMILLFDIEYFFLKQYRIVSDKHTKNTDSSVLRHQK